jgi:hypothetical protein
VTLAIQQVLTVKLGGVGVLTSIAINSVQDKGNSNKGSLFKRAVSENFRRATNGANAERSTHLTKCSRTVVCVCDPLQHKVANFMLF